MEHLFIFSVLICFWGVHSYPKRNITLSYQNHEDIVESRIDSAIRDHVLSASGEDIVIDENSDVRVIEKCNGFVELCDLDITQVSLAGSHNSGAGFDGPMKIHSKSGGQVPADSCSNRYQERTIYEQLVLGIRYFDIKACWVEKYEPRGAWVCHKNTFAGPLRSVLEQIDLWMNEPYNRNEIVVIHLQGEPEQRGGDKTQIGANIINQIMKMWEPSDSRNTLRRLAIQPSVEVKLGDAIRYNQRIYVIMHNELVLGHREPWIIPHWTVGRTNTDMSYLQSKGCYKLMDTMSKEKCQQESTHRFVRYDMYLKNGLCRRHLASKCRKFIHDGLSKCFTKTSTRRRTVNFVVVDYVNEEVVRAVRNQNIENIQYFLHKKASGVHNGKNTNLCNVIEKLTEMGVPVYLGNNHFQVY